MFKCFLKKLSKEKYCRKSISLIIALTLVFTSVSSNIAYAMPMAPAVPVVNSIPTNQFVVPFNIGRITDALYNGKSEEIIINIQDLHSHEQTQRNISSILNLLDRNYGIDKIYVEGAIGKVDTSWISKIADKNVKEKVVNNLLKSGRLTGGELYAIESGKDGILEGIEDKEIYLKNVDRLNEIYNKKSEIEQYLPKIKYVLEESVKKYYSTENLKINRIIKKNKDGKISADKYFGYIAKKASNTGIDINKYSQIKKFIGVIASQKSLKTELVNKEVGEILEGIKSKVTFAEYKKLTQKISNKEQETEFYNEIKKISEKEGILKKYPNATKFFNYIQMNEGINPVELVKEEKNIIKEIQDRNSKTVYEKEAYFLSRYIDLIESYLSNKMTADEYTYFVNNKNRFELLWKKYVDIDGIIDIQKYFNLFEDFYKDNVERNRIFVEKITGKKVEKEVEGIRIKGRADNKEKIVEEINSGKKIKVVITGGFHTYGFTKLLEDNGIDYCVITPNITEETLTAEKLYENVFKEQYKLQNQTFQKMLVSQVIGLLNKGEIASVIAQGENVLINYANNNGTINLNEIKEQPETETDKMVSKADAEKIAEIFAKTFFAKKAKFKEEREQAREAALEAKNAVSEILQKGKIKTEKTLVLPKTNTFLRKFNLSWLWTSIWAAILETIRHPIWTFFDPIGFVVAHYSGTGVLVKNEFYELVKKYEKKVVLNGKEKQQIENIKERMPGFFERLKGARSIQRFGLSAGIIAMAVTLTIIILFFNPISSVKVFTISITIDVSIGIVVGGIVAAIRHIVYNVKVVLNTKEEGIRNIEKAILSFWNVLINDERFSQITAKSVFDDIKKKLEDEKDNILKGGMYNSNTLGENIAEALDDHFNILDDNVLFWNRNIKDSVSDCSYFGLETNEQKIKNIKEYYVNYIKNNIKPQYKELYDRIKQEPYNLLVLPEGVPEDLQKQIGKKNKEGIDITKQQSFVKKIIQWLKIGWDNIVSIFSKKATIMAIVDINDEQAIKEAKAVAKKGVKVELVFTGKREDIMKVLPNDLIPTKENMIVGEDKKELFYELQNTIENLTIKIYESVEGGKLATAKDTINNVIKQLDGANKNVVYVSKNLVKDDSMEQQLDKAKSNNKLLAYSTKSIKSAMVRGIITLKNKAKALSDMKVKKENIMAILKIGEVETFVQELKVLKKKGIKTIMLEMTTIVDKQKLEKIKKVLKDEDMTVFYKIQIKQKNDTENAKMLTRGLWESGNIVIDLENYSEAENDVKNVIEQFGYIDTKKAFRYKLPKKMKPVNKSVVLNYNEAIEMINKKEGIFGEKTDEKAIVMIKETDGENMVINTSDIQKLINYNVNLAFDAEIIKDIDSQDTSKNGITMLEIIKSMFAQTNEAKLERSKAKRKMEGREFALKKIEEFTKYHTTEDILEKEEEICSVINNSDKDVIKYVKDLTDNKTVKTKEEAKFILTGILEVIELIKLTNEPVEDLRDDISDNANKLLEMLGQYRLLEGKSYVKDAGKEIVEKYQDKSFAEILDTLEQNLKQENAISNNKAAVLEGIIYLLLSSRLDIREEKEEMMEINIQSISKMLEAA